jgi:hypothetical protein
MTTHQHGHYLLGDRHGELEPDCENERYCRTLCQCLNEKSLLSCWPKSKGPWDRTATANSQSLGVLRMADQILRWTSGGRWEGNKDGRVVNRYISVEQLSIDVKLAGILAIGGPVRYKLKAGSHASNSFVQGIVTPKMHENFGANQSNNIVDMLVLPLMWAYHEPTLDHMIAPEVLLIIQEGYSIIRGGNAATYNPISKVPLHISRVENQVFI